MSAVGISDLLPHLQQFTNVSAERWIAASLTEAAALREHDDALYPSDPERMEDARQLHDAWRRWADDAEAVLRRVQASIPDADQVHGFAEPLHAMGYTRARLGMTPDKMVARREQVRRGEVYTLEEVRRELRLHARR